jgi:hypothetical protein
MDDREQLKVSEEPDEQLDNENEWTEQPSKRTRSDQGELQKW